MGRFGRLMTGTLAFSLLIMTGCSSAKPAAPAPAPKPTVNVRMSWGKVFQQTHWADIGKYVDPSVKLEIMEFKTTNDQLFALQSGSLDFSVMGYNQLASALVQGPMDVTVVMGLSNAPTRLVARKGLTINDWADLKGKKIGGARGSTQYMQVAIALKKHGIDINKDAQFVQFSGASDMIVGLQKNAVDAVMIWEPQASQAIVDGIGADVAIVAKTLYADSFSSGNAVVVSNKFLQAHPDVVQDMVNAYWKSYQKITTDKQYWIDTFNGLTGMDKKVLEVAATNCKPEYAMPMEQIKLITGTMFQLGFLEKDVTNQVQSKLDYTFLAKATGKTKADLGGK